MLGLKSYKVKKIQLYWNYVVFILINARKEFVLTIALLSVEGRQSLH